MRLMITRPLEDAAPLARELAALGVDSVIEPLLSIEPLDVAAPDLDGVQGLLLTSANGLRAFSAISAERSLPVFAVGDATARAALNAGFATVASADGDVHALAALVAARLRPEDGPLVHVAGSKMAGDLAAILARDGFDCRRLRLYRAVKATALSTAGLTAIKDASIEGVILYSPRTAESFVDLLTRAGAGECARRMNAFCLSQAVAARAGALDWAGLVVADSPDQAALLRCVRKFQVILLNRREDT